jgi:hypothetical protein
MAVGTLYHYVHKSYVCTMRTTKASPDWMAGPPIETLGPTNRFISHSIITFSMCLNAICSHVVPLLGDRLIKESSNWQLIKKG